MIACFLLEPTDAVRVCLRRFSDGDCPHGSYHNACTVIGRERAIYDDEGYLCNDLVLVAKDETRWPTQCACGYTFTERDPRQRFTERLYLCGEQEMTLADAPAGAMWYADWLRGFYESQDEGNHILMVKTPGGDWNIDGRASNCDRPDDRLHHCWVRHGTVPAITVDKSGVTCGAGGGSILIDGYHGFLRNGFLEGV